jgi:hypothetical protein
MADVVNLDALIPREDFLASEGADAGAVGKVEATCTDLTEGESFYSTLRKPDFQRETASWTPQAVCDFIQAFIDGDLIPSVICWQSPARLSFVIDGAHRFSAVIAWLQDDYGDGAKTIDFYNNVIPDEQRRIAKKTRTLVNLTVGSFKDYRAETQNPGSNPELTTRARALAHSKVPLLWIKGTDSAKAERAFRVINRSAVAIDPTELRILQTRFLPNAVAARAIIRNATGHKYWKTFSDEGQAEVVRLSQAVYKAFYSPPLQQPIKTIDLPIAGHGYGSQTLPLIYDFVNLANHTPVTDSSKDKGDAADKQESLPKQEVSEEATLKVLGSADRLARRLTGVHASSLGLHPAIYFYSANGRHQPTAVLATAALLVDLEDSEKLLEFTSVRRPFEDFLVEHKMFVNQLTTQHGSMAKGYRQLKDYFQFVLTQFMEGKRAEDVTLLLRDHDRYQRLVKERPITTDKPKPFSRNLKQLVILRETLSKAIECHWCHARVDSKSMHLDHVIDRDDGGLGDDANARLCHPYCDSTYKYYILEKEEEVAGR